MTQSAEYPDLVWIPPKSWTNANRTDVQVIVIHATDNTEGTTSAEDGARYDQVRTDGTSTHYFHDANSTIQCVRTEDIAHAARANGNRIGIQHELCGYASQSADQWADAASVATLRIAARQVARDCRKWGIPVIRLTPTGIAAGVKGICGHVDITAAFPQDHGTHTDPGPNFPWSMFLGLVQTELDGEDMPYTEAQMRAFPWQYAGGGIPAGISTLGALNEILLNSRAILANVRADDGDQSALLAALGEIPAEVLAQLGDASVSPDTAAGAIRELLGSAERVAAVKALL